MRRGRSQEAMCLHYGRCASNWSRRNNWRSNSRNNYRIRRVLAVISRVREVNWASSEVNKDSKDNKDNKDKGSRDKGSRDKDSRDKDSNRPPEVVEATANSNQGRVDV